ncbi:unnamed protein product [Owenia fusiformis]|uniref:PKD/REJ-like domain-containing protein n=1 Tax=Owenia fusiformis TaxID=6347 RepID=A0A8S4NGU0_OWEFU|nr:unnamed protein product [Owenia fusiformis]
MANCSEQLVSGRTYSVSDGAITVSSTLAGSLDHSEARSRLNQWIQVDLGEVMLVTGVVTQGRADEPQWVKTTMETLTGNSNSDTHVTNGMDPPLNARYVRIKPQSWEEHISLRFDIIGCPLPESYNPLAQCNWPVDPPPAVYSEYSALLSLENGTQIQNNTGVAVNEPLIARFSLRGIGPLHLKINVTAIDQYPSVQGENNSTPVPSLNLASLFPSNVGITQQIQLKDMVYYLNQTTDYSSGNGEYSPENSNRCTSDCIDSKEFCLMNHNDEFTHNFEITTPGYYSIWAHVSTKTSSIQRNIGKLYIEHPISTFNVVTDSPIIKPTLEMTYEFSPPLPSNINYTIKDGTFSETSSLTQMKGILTHAFSLPGEFDIKLTICNHVNQQSKSISVEVHERLESFDLQVLRESSSHNCGLSIQPSVKQSLFGSILETYPTGCVLTFKAYDSTQGASKYKYTILKLVNFADTVSGDKSAELVTQIETQSSIRHAFTSPGLFFIHCIVYTGDYTFKSGYVVVDIYPTLDISLTQVYYGETYEIDEIDYLKLGESIDMECKLDYDASKFTNDVVYTFYILETSSPLSYIDIVKRKEDGESDNDIGIVQYNLNLNSATQMQTLTLDKTGNYTSACKTVDPNTEATLINSKSFQAKKPTEGLYLISSSPVEYGSDVEFILFAQEVGMKSSFTVQYSDPSSNGNSPEAIPTLSQNQNISSQISAMVDLPFDPSTSYSSVFRHNYTLPGSYIVNVTIQEDIGVQFIGTQAVVMTVICHLPDVSIQGGGETRQDAVQYVTSQSIQLISNLKTDCSIASRATFHWKAFRIRALHHKEVTLPETVDTSLTTIVLPQFALPYGVYLLEFKVQLVTNPGLDLSVYSVGQTWLEIVPAPLQAKIVGGSARVVGYNKDITLDASRSFDPDLAPTTYKRLLDYTWFCRRELETFPTNWTMYNMTSGGCFNNGFVLPYTSSILHLDSSNFTPDQPYIFEVEVSQNDRSPSRATQSITVISGDPPQLEITCHINCVAFINPKERLALRVACTTCEEADILKYSWEIMQNGEKIEDFDWTVDTLTGRDKSSLVFVAGLFGITGEETYTLKVTALGSSGSPGYSQYTFTTNQPPVAGSCSVQPSSGYVLQTKFNLTCSGFSDANTPLTYGLFALRDKGYKNQTEELLMHGTNPTVSGIYLPMGHPSRGYILDMSVRVEDAYGAATEVFLDATVQKASVSLANLTTGENSVLDLLMKTGDDQGVTRLISSVGTLLNEESKSGMEDDLNPEERKELKQQRSKLRSAMVENLSQVKVQSLASLQQSSTAISAITKESSELTKDTQKKAALAVKDMAAFLRTSATSGISSKEGIDGAARTVISPRQHYLPWMTSNLQF